MGSTRESNFPNSRIDSTILATDIVTGLPVEINSRGTGGGNAIMTVSEGVNIVNTIISQQVLTVGTSVNFGSSLYNENLIYVLSAGGILTQTVNPQVTAPVLNGQKLWIYGTSDTDYNIFVNGLGLALNGTFSAMNGKMIQLIALSGVWTEISRV